MKTLRTYFLIIAAFAGISSQPSFAGYDPTKGRFLSRDPIEENGGVNLYGFVQNRPTQLIDAVGLSVFWLWDHEDEGAAGALSGREINGITFKKDSERHNEQKKKAAKDVENVSSSDTDKCKFFFKKRSWSNPNAKYEEVTKEEWLKYVSEDQLEVSFTAKKNFQADINSLSDMAKKAKNPWDDVGYAIHGLAELQGDRIRYSGEPDATPKPRADVLDAIGKLQTAGGNPVRAAICRPWPGKGGNFSWDRAMAGWKDANYQSSSQKAGGAHFYYEPVMMTFSPSSEKKQP